MEEAALYTTKTNIGMKFSTNGRGLKSLLSKETSYPETPTAPTQRNDRSRSGGSSMKRIKHSQRQLSKRPASIHKEKLLRYISDTSREGKDGCEAVSL